MLTDNISDDEMLLPTESLSQRKSIKNSIQQVSNEILKAYLVTAYKYVDSKYESRGKIGLALLGSKVNNNFSILLYGKGNVALTQANINKDFDITSGRDLYISFYDIKSENWSLLFENTELYIDFYNRISILKLITSKQEMIFYDVKNGEGNLIRDSDLCEAEIVINAVKNYEITSTLYNSETYETNKFLRFKIGSNKLMPAIDKGVIGMMKGGHRIICASSNSSLIKGGPIKVAPDNFILAHVKIIRIKGKTEKPMITNDLGDAEISLPNINFNEKNVESEIGQQSKKAELINLMQRIGKPILQFQTTEHEPKDVETYSNFHYTNSVYENIPDYNSRGLSSVNVPSYNNQLLPLHTQNPMISTVHQFYPTLGSVPPTSDNNLVFTETRQHNTEMRIAISKLQDKIDKIAEKIESNNSIQKMSVTRHMDAENVYENIKRIIDENDILKRECSQKSDIVDSQNKRINELLNKNQRYLEDSRNVMDRNTLTFSNTESENQFKILKLEEEKLDLIRSLSKKTSDIGVLELKMESLNNESQSYRNKSLEFNEQMNKLTTELNDFKLKNRSMLTELDTLKGDNTKTFAIKEELEKSQRQSSENERKLHQNIDTLKNHIKEANNNIETVKSECDSEIIEIRQRCNQEIEDLRNKLKQERRMTSSKSCDLEIEIESMNKEWEIKLNELKKLEYSKLLKINERNSQLMMENSTLNHEILDLKDQLSQINSNKTIKEEELLTNNRQLQRKVEEFQDKIDVIESLRFQNNNYEKEISKLTLEIKELIEIKKDYDSTIKRKKELESMIITLTEELNAKPLENETKMPNDENIEEQIKIIMNDVFKKIKSEFIQDKSYNGKEIIGKCMIVIRDSTVSLIKSNDSADESGDEIKDSSESDDSDSENNTTENNDKNTVTILDSLQTVLAKETFDNFVDDSAIIVDEAINNSKKDLVDIIIDTNIAEPINDPKINDNEENIYLKEQAYDIDSKMDNDVNSQNEEVITRIEELESQIVEDHQNFNKLIDKDELTNKEFESDHEEISKPVQDSENVSNKPTIQIEVPKIDLNVSLSKTKPNDNIHSSKNIENTMLFSSDEDEDVSGFFEQLNKKKKENEVKVEQSKPISIVGIDDDLSWLNS